MNLKQTMKLAEEYREWMRTSDFLQPSKKLPTGDAFVKWVDVRKVAYANLKAHAYDQFPKLLVALKNVHTCCKEDCKMCNDVRLVLEEAEKLP